MWDILSRGRGWNKEEIRRRDRKRGETVRKAETFLHINNERGAIWNIFRLTRIRAICIHRSLSTYAITSDEAVGRGGGMGLGVSGVMRVILEGNFDG